MISKSGVISDGTAKPPPSPVFMIAQASGDYWTQRPKKQMLALSAGKHHFLAKLPTAKTPNIIKPNRL